MARRNVEAELTLVLLAVISLGFSVNGSTFGAGLSVRSFPSTYARKTGNIMAFSHISNGIYPISSSGNEIDDPPTICTLLQRARRIRGKRYGDGAVPTSLPNSSQLSYPESVYNMETDNNLRFRNRKITVQRGFCNWLLPQTIMIGQYPGMTPEANGPSSNECRLHIQNMVRDANVSLFCCLQTEVPSQDDDEGWKDGGEVYLEPESVRREFPRPFARYGPLARSLAVSTSQQLAFLHSPIEDLGIPTSNADLLRLLSRLLGHLESEGDRTIIYLHCWGGRGRAGLVGSCLAALLFPELSSEEILDWVQRGYDTRLGAEHMPKGLKRSPQTQDQRWFVKEFVEIVRAERKEN